MPTTADLISNAIETKPVDFADTFNNLIGQKLVDALANRKIELAQSIYNTAGPDEEEDDTFDFDLDDDGLDDDEDEEEYFTDDDDDDFSRDDNNEDA